jgi:pimeloyl-ACP methyl ester carboxylesterase
VRAPISHRSLRSTVLVLAAGLVLSTTACNRSAQIRTQALQDSEAVTFTTEDGVRLAGRIFGPDTASAGVVLAHMLASDQSSWFDFADRLGRAGYRVLTFDFRGYCPGGDAGCSKGQKNLAAAPQDVAAAQTYLREEGPTRIALVGASMGGTASLVSASQNPAGIEGVATLSSPASIGGLVAGPDVMAAVTPAKLFMAGDSDPDGAAAAAQQFYDASVQPKRLEIFTTADHGTDLLSGNQGEQSRAALLGWLAQYLPLETPGQGG